MENKEHGSWGRWEKGGGRGRGWGKGKVEMGWEGGGGGGGLSDQAHVFELLLLQEMHRAQGYSSRVRYY